MKLYKTTITPTSNFGTSLKGDTFFGQLCWAIRYKFGIQTLETLLENYMQKPFLIVSDGFANGYLPKPTMPSRLLGEKSDEKKQNRKKVWLRLEELQAGAFSKAREDIENTTIINQDISINVMKNSIDYKKFSTDSDSFDPYGKNELVLSVKDIYLLFDDSIFVQDLNRDFTLDDLKSCVEFVDLMGFGKNASTGKGRFLSGVFEEIKIAKSSKYFMTLSPCVLEGLQYKNVFYEPFTRFGKHGGALSNKNPFKKPIILADTKGVVVFEKEETLQYIGRGIQGHSHHKKTVHQGYSIVIPIQGMDDEK
jgi:CRISPR-associated protein Csm4